MDLIHVVDHSCFALAAVAVCYLFVFSLFSLCKQRKSYPPALSLHRLVVLFPAYKEDSVIEVAVQSVLNQSYPKEYYDIIVISDQMKEATNDRLRSLPIRLLEARFAESSKAAALQFAMSELEAETYDMVIILDADNRVEPDFLHQINKVCDAGVCAVQAHRKAQPCHSDTAILDAVSEEINNNIYRKGHVCLGLSSALIGSGTALDFKWFKENVQSINSAGEDKELELLLLKEGIFIDYLENVPVYDEKIQGEKDFYRQRRRWIAAQFDLLGRGFKELPSAILSGNIDYCDKIFQWLIPPRIVLLGFLFLVALSLTFVDWYASLKWWGVLFLLLVTLSLAMPDELYNKQFISALKRLPVLFLLMVVNLFRTKGVNKRFIHTKHGEGIE